MLDAARKQAERSGITHITFVEGSIDDLSRFRDNDFDLALCLDSPLSFCGDRYETAITELLRVTTGPLIL
jgi:ubiquinone/menaquinone biosynthesis C-methylase UbiE